jgi:hypothetical protein
MDRETMFEQLCASEKVTFVSRFPDGRIIAHSRDVALVQSLRERGAAVRWFDRVEFSTKAGKSKADQQAEIVLGRAFFGET